MSAASSKSARSPLQTARRVVVKVGSALLVDARTGRLNRAWLESLVEDLLRMRRRGQQIILVSSGAIALGRRHLDLAAGALQLEQSQAAAAVGQIRLAHAYKELLEPHDVTVAQILLTLDDSEQRNRFLNARATLETLLALNALPVINENDTVATAEIRYGDNDRLAARVAQMSSADCLVLLSDVDGLYTADPNVDTHAEFIPTVEQITPQIEAMGGRSASAVGSGGMATKIAAARIAVSAAEAHRTTRALHVVPAALHAAGRAQAVDRRHAAPGRGRAHRCRRAARAARWQQPAASRRDQHHWTLRCR
jgi:glutamate 5-kinase